MGELIIDSAYTLDEVLAGKEIPQDIRSTLVIIEPQYISFDGKLHKGQLVVHEKVSEELQTIFMELLKLHFPIEKIIPVVFYNGNDDLSMEDNNSSAFNYRVIHGTTELSNHSYGLAIDINPKMNPYIARDGSVLPKNATHNFEEPGTLVPESDAVRAFTSRGWEWGGDWQRKDWQHFEKRIN